MFLTFLSLFLTFSRRFLVVCIHFFICLFLLSHSHCTHTVCMCVPSHTQTTHAQQQKLQISLFLSVFLVFFSWKHDHKRIPDVFLCYSYLFSFVLCFFRQISLCSYLRVFSFSKLRKFHASLFSIVWTQFCVSWADIWWTSTLIVSSRWSYRLFLFSFSNFWLSLPAAYG